MYPGRCIDVPAMEVDAAAATLQQRSAACAASGLSMSSMFETLCLSLESFKLSNVDNSQGGRHLSGMTVSGSRPEDDGAGAGAVIALAVKRLTLCCVIEKSERRRAGRELRGKRGRCVDEPM
jgi:hypothetical protein